MGSPRNPSLSSFRFLNFPFGLVNTLSKWCEVLSVGWCGVVRECFLCQIAELFPAKRAAKDTQSNTYFASWSSSPTPSFKTIPKVKCFCMTTKSGSHNRIWPAYPLSHFFTPFSWQYVSLLMWSSLGFCCWSTFHHRIVGNSCAKHVSMSPPPHFPSDCGTFPLMRREWMWHTEPSI